jgi:AraC family transcriptional regulator
MKSDPHVLRLYNERIHQAVDYITDHISDQITLEQLAEAACFSPYHFHRIFTAAMGETPRNFIERTKLEKAANQLCLMPNKTVADVAFQVGYSSVSTFSRAFKKHHNISPSEFLDKHIHDFHSMNVPNYQSHSVNGREVCHFIKFEKFPAMHVPYCQTLNGYAPGIPKAWNNLIGIAKMKEWLNESTRFIGIPYDNPGITPREKCRYRACITVAENIAFDKGSIKTMTLKAGYYAIFHFRGRKENITDAYALIYGEWLPPSGYLPDNIPLLEIYPPGLHAHCNLEILEYNIALPITTL